MNDLGLENLTTAQKIELLHRKIVDAAGLPLFKRGTIAMQAISLAVSVINDHEESLAVMQHELSKLQQEVKNNGSKTRQVTTANRGNNQLPGRA